MLFAFERDNFLIKLQRGE